MQKRVVITGIGVKSPIGNSIDTFQKNLYANYCSIQKIKEWEDIDKLKTKIAGIVPSFDEKEIPRSNRRSMDRAAILGVLATKDALFDAKLKENEISTYKTGLTYGSTVGAGLTLDKVFGDLRELNSYANQTAMDFLKYMPNTVCANIASFFNIIGINLPINSACTSSSQAIGLAYELIKNGSLKRAISGGSEGMHHSLAATFDVISAASYNYNNHPTKASRPFDKNRDGVVVSEGAATLILEDLESALNRDAKIYAEIVSYSTNCNGGHLTNPNEDRIYDVMKEALEKANLNAKDIDYINAHATATNMGDIYESNAIYKLFQDKIPVSSSKGHLGHTLGACGAIETIVSILSMKNNILPSTLNLEAIDAECANLNYIQEITTSPINTVLTNNFAFGGTNTSIILKKYIR